MVNIENLYHTFLEIENTKNREKYDNYKGWFSASTAGSCFKRQLLKSEGKEGPPFDSRVMRLLRLGTIVHNDIQGAIEASPEYNSDDYAFYIEKRIEIPEIKLVGHLDIGIFNKKTGHLKVMDIKTCASYKWRMMFGRNASPNGSPNYKLQLGTYSGALADELTAESLEMSLLWYNKDTSAFKEQIVGQEWVIKAKEYWEELSDYTDTDNTNSDSLKVGSYGVPMENWECKYCNFKDIYCAGV